MFSDCFLTKDSRNYFGGTVKRGNAPITIYGKNTFGNAFQDDLGYVV
jgi:hypothetical protein